MLITEVFDLIFASSEPERCRYEKRRWFRTPTPLDQDPAAGTVEPAEQDRDDAMVDVTEAEELLSTRVAERSRIWAASAGIETHADFDPKRHLPPRMPYDVFAIAAHLLEQGGVYHHIQPTKEAAPASTATMSGGTAQPRALPISHADRAQVQAVARAWRNLPRLTQGARDFASEMLEDETWKEIEPLFESWWIVFAACATAPVADRPEGTGPSAPILWRHAWRLLAIADEAAAGTGFVFDVDELRAYLGDKPSDITWIEAEVMLEHMLAGPSEEDLTEPRAEFRDVNSLSVARSSILNVLPKVRTPSVGCTLRSISHHLALLPPLGVVKGQWTPNYRRRAGADGRGSSRQMNLLLVPMPFSLGARCFGPAFLETTETGADGERPAPKIGYFDVDQERLGAAGNTDKIAEFIKNLVDAAHDFAQDVHGVVLPELALDYPHFTRLKEVLRDCCPGIEVLVAGTSSDRSGSKGNFVAATTFRDAASGQSDGRESVREKHHRWKLDPAQLREYGLQGVLSPEQSWWENIPLQARQVDFTVMRRDSVFAAMICEDLARVDPCQQIIRAVGPNLVIALLMDAPQIEARWPARYATVLAEDPGCAVLTLTSRGLMTLQDRLGTHKSRGGDRIIALWRDDASSRPVTLECPYDAQGVLLTILEESSADVSLDGRVDTHAKAWRHAGHVPVRLENVKKDHSEVLGPENMLSF